MSVATPPYIAETSPPSEKTTTMIATAMPEANKLYSAAVVDPDPLSANVRNIPKAHPRRDIKLSLVAREAPSTVPQIGRAWSIADAI